MAAARLEVSILEKVCQSPTMGSWVLNAWMVAASIEPAPWASGMLKSSLRRLTQLAEPLTAYCPSVVKQPPKLWGCAPTQYATARIRITIVLFIIVMS